MFERTNANRTVHYFALLHICVLGLGMDSCRLGDIIVHSCRIIDEFSADRLQCDRLENERDAPFNNVVLSICVQSYLALMVTRGSDKCSGS